MPPPPHTASLLPVRSLQDIPPEYRDTPIADLLAYHQLDAPFREYQRAELLVGMCMDHRKSLRLPPNFAYVLRTGGANLRGYEFKVSFAIAVGGARAVALIGHTDCGMVGLEDRRQAFVEGLATRAGWDAEAAARHFDAHAPAFGIPDAAGFVRDEAVRLRERYPDVPICPLLYRVEDGRLYLVSEADPSEGHPPDVG